MALREGGPPATNGRRPRSGRDSARADPEIRSRSGDPAAGEITSLTLCIASAFGRDVFSSRCVASIIQSKTYRIGIGVFSCLLSFLGHHKDHIPKSIMAPIFVDNS
jgi:hypothetical protein